MVSALHKLVTNLLYLLRHLPTYIQSQYPHWAIENEGLLKVTGSHVHGKSGNI